MYKIGSVLFKQFIVEKLLSRGSLPEISLHGHHTDSSY